ncbi:PH domain-containing protein [Spirosoma horti]
MTTYKSKIGLELAIPLFLILGGTGALMIYNRVWPGLFIIISVSLFIAHLFLTTYYQIDGQMLIIRSGFLFSKSLNISTIKGIDETRNPQSSPATSIDRLEIRYNKFDSVLVSPKDKTAFIHALTMLNPAIVVRLKKEKQETHYQQ